MEEKQPSQQKERPPWLKHLQENSWEAEILISGGAIFSLFQLSDSLVSAGDYMKEITPFPGLNFVLLSLMIILRGVTIGFMLHLFIRGLWIALVCLGSVYPTGTNFNKLKITGRYLKKAKETDLTHRIIQLDELSGLIFFGSFLFILVIFGMMLVFAFIGVAQHFLSSSPWYDTISLLFTFLIIVYALDIASSGLFRKNKVVGKLYFPIFSFFNAISLGFFYRPFLQVVSTNINRWKAGFFLLILFIASYLFAWVTLQGIFLQGNIFDQRAYPGVAGEDYSSDDLYLDRIPAESRVRRACIQSDFVKNDYLRVFIPYRARYDEDIERNDKKTFSEIISVSINDSTYHHIDWSGYGRELSGQRGIIGYLPITHLLKGKNELAIQIKGETFYHNRLNKLVIPFWKE